MPQSRACPSSISRSTYMAWCARWKPPTPKCTIPVLIRPRSYPGTGTDSGNDPMVSALSCVMGGLPWSMGGTDDGLDGSGGAPGRGERLLHLLQAEVAGHQEVQVDPAGRRQRDRGGPGVRVPKGAGQHELVVLHVRQRQHQLVAAHADQDDAAGARDRADGVP